jgi:hypothetical protein
MVLAPKVKPVPAKPKAKPAAPEGTSKPVREQPAGKPKAGPETPVIQAVSPTTEAAKQPE